MKNNVKSKIAVDILMTLCLLLLMSYELVGDAAHEWIGMGMFLLFVCHHILNRKWTGSVTKGKYTSLRVIQTILVVLLLLSMIGSMVSGIVLSNYVFKFVKIKGAANLARNIHMLCAYWGFLLMSIHLGFHWNMMIAMAAKAMRGKKKGVEWTARCVAVAIAGYGVYAFWKRNFADYLFLRTHFVFFDIGESLAGFLLDYVAIMELFVFLTYYGCKLVRNTYNPKV